jgi:transketolase
MDTKFHRIHRLKRMCVEVRRDIVEMIYRAKGGHPGGALSAVEIITVLFFDAMRLRPEEADWPERDRFILSKGHVTPVLYSAMARRGFFPVEELATFGAPGTRLQKHVDKHFLPYVEVSSGSLGQGLSIGVGMALADRIDHRTRNIFVLNSDGENQEGQTWEAAMGAAHFRLDQIIAFLDNNGLQTDGAVADIMSIEPLEDKWRSFGWHVQRVDGHDVEQIISAIDLAKSTKDKPHIVIADTVKGKGVSFIEGKYEWHSHSLSDEEYRIALGELEAAERELEGRERAAWPS